MIQQRKNKFTVAGNLEYNLNSHHTFRTVVSEVSSFVGNPVLILYVPFVDCVGIKIPIGIHMDLMVLSIFQKAVTIDHNLTY